MKQSSLILNAVNHFSAVDYNGIHSVILFSEQISCITLIYFGQIVHSNALHFLLVLTCLGGRKSLQELPMKRQCDRLCVWYCSALPVTYCCQLEHARFQLLVNTPSQWINFLKGRMLVTGVRLKQNIRRSPQNPAQKRQKFTIIDSIVMII